MLGRCRLSGERLRATLVSFISASIVMLLASVVAGIYFHEQHKYILDFNATIWWMFFGGVIGTTHAYGGWENDDDDDQSVNESLKIM